MEKKFTDTETRLFPVRGLLFRFPAHLKVDLRVENPVLLVNAEGKAIGSANVFPAEGGGVVAEGLFQYSCPERLDIETGIAHYFHPEVDMRFLYSEKTEETGKKKLVPEVILGVGKVLISADKRADDEGLLPVVPVSEEESP